MPEEKAKEMPGVKEIGVHLHFPEKKPKTGERGLLPGEREMAMGYFPLSERDAWRKIIERNVTKFKGCKEARADLNKSVDEYERDLIQARGDPEKELEAGSKLVAGFETVRDRFNEDTEGWRAIDRLREALVRRGERRLEEEAAETAAAVPPPGEPPRPPERPITPESIDIGVVREKLTQGTARNTLRRIFLEEPRGLFYGVGGETLEKVPLEIEGRSYTNKEAVINACLEVLRGEEAFLEDFRVWRSLCNLKWTAHERIKTTRNGEELEVAVSQMEDQGLLPTEEEWSRMVDYFQEWQGTKGDQNWRGHFAIYADPEFIIADYKRRSGESDEDLEKRREYFWNDVYLYSLERRGIKLSKEALEEVKVLVFSKDDELEKRSKLTAIEMMREISSIPYRFHKTDRSGKRVYDVYPTGGLSREIIERQVEGIEPIEERESATHVLNRTRRVVGFEDAVTNSLHYNQDYKEWLYHTVRYALETRILAMVANGVSAYGSEEPLRLGLLQAPNDIKILDETRASNMTLYAIAMISGMSVGEEKPAKTGDFWNHLRGRDRYSEEHLKARGIPETVIPYLSWIPGRDEIIDIFFERTSLDYYLHPNAIYAVGRGPEANNLLNFLYDMVGYCALTNRRIMEACGVAEFSWRGRALGSIMLAPDEIGRIFLNYLYQRKRERSADGTLLEVPDKELVNALLDLPVPFERVEAAYLDERGKKREGVVDEEKLVWKLVDLKAKGLQWQWETADMVDTSNGKIGKYLTPLERAYLEKDPVEHPRRLRDKIWALSLRKLTPDQRFEVLFKLATQKRKGEIQYGIREIGPFGEPIFRWVTIIPEQVDARVAINQRVKAALEKLREEKVRELAAEIGDEEAMRRLGLSIRIIGMEKIRRLAAAMQAGEEIKPQDRLYQELVLSQKEVEDLVEKENRRVEAMQERARIEAEGRSPDESVIRNSEFDRLDYLESLGKLDRERYDQLGDALRGTRLMGQILGLKGKEYEPIKEITKEHRILKESNLSEGEKDDVLSALKTPEIRALIFESGLDGITEEFGLTDDEKTYLRGRFKTGDDRVMVLERKEEVNEREILRKWRLNMQEGREATHGFDEREKRHFQGYENQIRLKAINELERERARREINGIRLKLENEVKGEEEKKKFWHEEVMKNGRTDFEVLTEKERGLLQRWVEHPGEVYFNVEEDAEPFTNSQEVSYRLLVDVREGLLGYYNWRTMRNVFGLDYPWLDLQRRSFLSHVYGWAIERKIGVISDEALENLVGKSALEKRLHPEKEKRPFFLDQLFLAPDTRRNPDAIIDFLNIMLQEKLAMHFRFNLKIERGGVLVPAPVVPLMTRERGGDLRLWYKGIVVGDPGAHWEVGDATYSEAAFMGHERHDEPDTLALRDRLAQVAQDRLRTCPRFLKARLGALTLRHIMRLVPNEWDLFKTRDMKPRTLFRLKVVTENEEGYYPGLENAAILSGPIAECLKRIEGINFSDPEAYRGRMAKWGIMDEVEKKIGIESFVEQVKSTAREIPVLGQILEKIPTVNVPAIAFEIPGVTTFGGILAELIRVTFFATRGGFSLGWPGLGAALGVVGFIVPVVIKARVIEKLTREGRLYDCVLDVKELAQRTIESITKRTGGRAR